MRKYIVLTSLTLALTVLAIYARQVLTPFNNEQVEELLRVEQISTGQEFDVVIGELATRGLLINYLSINNLLLIILITLAPIVSFTMLVQVLFERIFWRKFYESVRLGVALRRSIVVALCVASIWIYRLFAAEDYLIYLTILLLIIIETVATKLANSQDTQGDSTLSESTEVVINEQVQSNRRKRLNNIFKFLKRKNIEDSPEMEDIKPEDGD